PAGKLVLAHSMRHKLAGCPGPEAGVIAEGDGDRARFAAGERFLQVEAAVLALVDLDADEVRAMNHAAVGAQVDPALLRIAGDDGAAGAQVATAIQLVPADGGEAQEVDFSPTHLIG